MNVFDFAMKMEMDGKAFYEKLAKESTIPGLKTIFTRLAEDEQKHFEIFQALQNKSADAPAMNDSTALEAAKNIFEELETRGEKPSIQGDLEGYRYAMKLEAESVRLYEEAAGKEENGDLRSLLLRIAAEEQNHFNILENLYDFINAPNEYLAWREFSNLGEFRQFGREVDR